MRTSGTPSRQGWTVTNLSGGTPDMFCMDCPRARCSRDCKILEDLRIVNRDQQFAVSSRIRTRKKSPLQANNNWFKESPELKMTRKWEISRGMYRMCLSCSYFSYRDLLMAKTGEKILGASLV